MNWYLYTVSGREIDPTSELFNEEPSFHVVGLMKSENDSTDTSANE